MNRSIFFTALLFIFAFSASVLAQGPPASTDARDTLDSGVKGRSVEMERVKRDADADDTAASKAAFDEIKEDFEQIQISFDSGVVKTYKMTNPIDYNKIVTSSDDIKARALRLRTNLFEVKTKKKDKKKKDETPTVYDGPTDVRSLIMNLNDSLSSFVASPIFQNAKELDPKDKEKARLDLENIIAQSTRLSMEAAKLKTP